MVEAGLWVGDSCAGPLARFDAGRRGHCCVEYPFVARPAVKYMEEVVSGRIAGRGRVGLIVAC